MKFSVVIPNFNGEELLKKNLPYVLALGADEVIVVDDGSSDQSVVYLKSQISKVKTTTQRLKILESQENIGFAKSVNKGVKIAIGDVVVLLNTDVKPDEDLLKYVTPRFKNSKVFGVSFAEEKFSYSRGFWKNGYVEHSPGERSIKTHETFWVSGGSGAFRKSIWDKLGGLDEIYAPFYWEDIDLCYRAAKRGYKNLWEPKAKVMHEHEATIGKYHSKDKISFIQERNQLIFIWKNITSPKLMSEHRKALVKRIAKSPGYIKVVLSALSKWNRITRARNVEISQGIVTDEMIFAQFV